MSDSERSYSGTAVAAVLLALMILGLGAGRFHMRWAQPFAVVFAVWWVSRVPRGFVSLPAVWRFVRRVVAEVRQFPVSGTV